MRKETVERVWRAMKTGFRGRQRLVVPLVGVALALSCQSSETNLATLSKREPTPIVVQTPNLPVFPPTVLDPYAWNYCQEATPASGPVERRTAGLPVAKEEVVTVSKAPPKVENAPDDIDLLDIKKSNIKHGEKQNPGDFNITLIPAEYNDGSLDSRMRYLVNGLGIAFQGVKIEFSYLDISTSYDIDRTKQFTEVNEHTKLRFNRLMKKIKSAASIDEGAIVVNEQALMGSCCNPAIASGNSPESITVIAHEIAHIFNIYDGHKNRSYKKEQLNNESLALNPESLFGGVRRAYLEERPNVVVVGSCNGEPVYSMGDPGANIMMGNYPKDSDLFAKKREFIFNPVQKTIMNNKIEELIKNRTQR